MTNPEYYHNLLILEELRLSLDNDLSLLETIVREWEAWDDATELPF